MILNPTDIEYRKVLTNIMDKGNDRTDRTGVGTRSLFGQHISVPLSPEFPILTTKRVHFKSVALELIWFISGNTNIKFLLDHGVTIWNEWADKDGNLGPVYGAQWRNFNNSIDQLTETIKSLKDNPFSRRHIVTAWNPSEVNDMALPPCHLLYQFYVREDDTGKRFLSCHMFQRSVDIFLGAPFNISSYSLLTYMIAKLLGYCVDSLHISFGDAHVYKNHFSQVEEYLSRSPTYCRPRLILSDEPKTIDEFKFQHITLEDYKPNKTISAQIAV